MPPTFEDMPYCGPAPVPETLWGAWNFDPWVLAGLAGLAVSFLSVADASRNPRRWRAFWAGWAVLAVAFVSPLCALSVALFSARVLHHVLLVAVAAPLLALAFRPSAGSGRAIAPLPVLFLAHTAAMWIWHAPGPYDFALSHDAAYWLMEMTLLLSAVALWRAIFRPGASEGGVMAVLLGSIVQMGMLGALLTFAAWPLLAAHATTTQAFGFTPMEDQQLAGLLMWVPAMLPYLLVALYRLSAFLKTEAGPIGHEPRE